MSDTVIKIENLSKQYRLGLVGTGTLSHDLNRWWHRVRGREDPYLKIGENNDRAVSGNSRYAWALRDINLEVKQGEVLGIIGKNGAGKSTLLKILSRVTGPTTGSVKVKGRIGSLLEVGTGFHPELTGRENIFLNGAILGMTKWEIKSKLEEIIEFSGTARYIDTPVKRYSSGMKVRLAFAVAAHLDPEILVVDEVLAVGDAEFQRKALGKMGEVSKNNGKTILFVSHNMGAINTLCSECILINKGEIIDRGLSNTITNKYLNLNSEFKELDEEDDFEYLKTRESGINFLLGETALFRFMNKSFKYEGVIAIKVDFFDFKGNNITRVNSYFKGVTFKGIYPGDEIQINLHKLQFVPGIYSLSFELLDPIHKKTIYRCNKNHPFTVVDGDFYKSGIPIRNAKNLSFYVDFDTKVL